MQTKESERFTEGEQFSTFTGGGESLFAHDEYLNQPEYQARGPIQGELPQEGDGVLWEVEDQKASLGQGLRFNRSRDVLSEATIEAWGQGVFESISQSHLKELERYVSDFLSFLHCPQFKSFDTMDMIRIMFAYLDYHDMYFCFFDMPVQMVMDQHEYTYIHKTTGETLNPEHTEVFQVVRGWDFAPFKEFKRRISHPSVQAYGKGERVMHGKEQRPINREDILRILCEPVYGTYDENSSQSRQSGIKEYVEDQIDGYLSEQSFDQMNDLEAVTTLKDVRLAIIETTVAAGIAVAAWIKSPMAVPFLSQWHPVYYHILGWDNDTNKAYIEKNTGGEAIVTGWDVYTLKSVTKVESMPAGSCRSCTLPLHCTHIINANALIYKRCSCGKTVHPEDLELRLHSVSGGVYGGSAPDEACIPYRKAHPSMPSFVCYRCAEKHLLFETAMQAPTQYKCSRTVCPNTGCAHHWGEATRRHVLNQRRIRMLPAPAPA